MLICDEHSGCRQPVTADVFKKKKKKISKHILNAWAALQPTPILESKHHRWRLKPQSKWHWITFLCEWRDGQFAGVSWNLAAFWLNMTSWDARAFLHLRTEQESNAPFSVSCDNKQRKPLQDCCVRFFIPELGYKYHDLWPLYHTGGKRHGEFC